MIGRLLSGRGMRGPVGLVFVILVLAVPSSVPAEAKPGFTVHPPESWKVFGLAGTRGYSVLAVFAGQKVTVEAISRNSVVRYIVPARSRGGVTTARIGRLGVISMRFRPAGPYFPTTEPQGDCRGRRAQVQRGMFEGRFRWRGEKGFSQARTHRVSGISVRSYREVCRGETAAIGRDEADRPFVSARLKAHRQAREVEVYGSVKEGVTLVGRLISELPSLFIERTVISYLDRGLWVDSQGNQIITGDSPYRGAAELRANPDENERWSGDLEAKFPGQGYVALAGTGFEIDPIPNSPSVRPVGFRGTVAAPSLGVPIRTDEKVS